MCKLYERVKSVLFVQPVAYNRSGIAVMELPRKTNIFLPKMILKMISFSKRLDMLVPY